MANIPIQFSMMSSAIAAADAQGVRKPFDWISFQDLLVRAGVPAFVQTSGGESERQDPVGAFAQYMSAYWNSQYNWDYYITPWLASIGYDIGFAYLPSNVVRYLVFRNDQPTDVYIDVSLDDAAFGYAALAFAAFASYVVIVDMTVAATAEVAVSSSAAPSAVETTASLAPGEEIVGEAAVVTAPETVEAGAVVAPETTEIGAALPDYVYTPPTFEAPIPEVTISPGAAAPSGFTLSDITTAVKTIGSTVGSALTLVKAFKQAGQPAPRTSSAVSSTSAPGQPMVLPDGSVYVNNGDGTYTMIDAAGNTSTHRFTSLTAGKISPWVLIAGAAVLGGVLLATRRSR